MAYISKGNDLKGKKPDTKSISNCTIFQKAGIDFKRDQLKVQVTSKLTLRLMGERLITENRWHRFNLELPLLFYYDTDSVTAKFKGAKLSIKFGELSQTKRKETLITPPSQKIEHQKPTLEDV
ncbi:hypothetical protein JHK87_010145 [Glycine soja]|nr:hypothetical protein JHK87_010145 [Glycine soja]